MIPMISVEPETEISVAQALSKKLIKPKKWLQHTVALLCVKRKNVETYHTGCTCQSLSVAFVESDFSQPVVVNNTHSFYYMRILITVLLFV